MYSLQMHCVILAAYSLSYLFRRISPALMYFMPYRCHTSSAGRARLMSRGKIHDGRRSVPALLS